MIIVRRLIITALLTFLVNPIARLFCVFPFMLVFLFHHRNTLPYQSQVLNRLETVCFFAFCILVSGNLFRAFVFVYGVPLQYPINVIDQAFNWFEYVVLSLPFIVLVFYIIFKITYKIITFIRRKLS